MTKAALKSELHQFIEKTESQALLEFVYSILNVSPPKQGRRISRKQYNKELGQAIRQGEQGKFSSLESVKKEFGKW